MAELGPTWPAGPAKINPAAAARRHHRHMVSLKRVATALLVPGLLTGLLTTAGPATAASSRTRVSADGMPSGGGRSTGTGPHCRREPVATLDATIQHIMRKADIPGVIVGLWRPGRCEYVRAFGLADTKTDRDMTPDLLMRIGSETKTFTATALLELVDDHRVGLDDPISKYVSGVPDGNHITLRELAAMRSGLFPYTSDPGFITAVQTNPRAYFSPQQLLAYGFKHPNTFPPGTQTQYSNTNYILLGLVVEKVSHLPLARFLRERVIDPSCLRHTLFPYGAEFPRPHAHGYTNQTLSGEVTDATDWNTSWAWAAGAMISNLRALRKWAYDVATGTLLTPETQAERTDFIPTGLPGVSYGLGLFDVNGWIGHDGSIPGYQSLTIYLPGQHATLVVLVNTDISYQGVAPTTLFGKAITSIVTPHHIYDIP
jgi:D-alanyl-D-alanine carboxypeptidase